MIKGFLASIIGVIMLFLVGCEGCKRHDRDWGGMHRGRGYQVDIIRGTCVLISQGYNTVETRPEGVSFNGHTLAIDDTRLKCWLVWGEGKTALLKELDSTQMKYLKCYIMANKFNYSIDDILSIIGLSIEEIESAFNEETGNR